MGTKRGLTTAILAHSGTLATTGASDETVEEFYQGKMNFPRSAPGLATFMI